MHIVYETLGNLGVENKKILTLFNKQDLRQDLDPLHDFSADKTINISAKFGQGLEEVKEVLEAFLREDKILVERVFAYDKAGVIQLIRSKGELLKEEFRPEGIYVKAYVPGDVYGKMD